jgi:hypothetical protein
MSATGHSGSARAVIVLFTRDLRVHDQPALAEAARLASHVVPLFVLDHALLRSFGAPNRVAFPFSSRPCRIFASRCGRSEGT